MAILICISGGENGGTTGHKTTGNTADGNVLVWDKCYCRIVSTHWLRPSRMAYCNHKTRNDEFPK